MSKKGIVIAAASVVAGIAIAAGVAKVKQRKLHIRQI